MRQAQNSDFQLGWKRIEYKGWSNAYCMQTTNLYMIVVADIGARIMEYGLPGCNILWQNPEYFGATMEDKGHFLPGGSQFDLLDEKEHSFSDKDSTLWVGKYRAEIRSPMYLTTVSPVASNFGLQITRDFEVDPLSGCLTIVQTVYNHGNKEKKVCIWDRTWTIGPCLLALPVESDKQWPEGWGFMALNEKGRHQFLPKVHNPEAAVQFRFTDGVLTIKPEGHLCQVVMRNNQGWFAYALDRLLYIKRYTLGGGQYPLLNCPAVAWLSDNEFKGVGLMAEMEPMSPLFEVAAGKSCTFREDWHLHLFESPIKTPEQLRKALKDILAGKNQQS